MKTDLIEKLDGQARIQDWAVVLPPPSKGKLMDEQHRAVATALADFLEHTALSQSAAAKTIGVGASTVSQFLSGSYPGDLDKLTHRINRWLEREGRKRQVRVELPYIRTRVAQHMRRVVSLAVEHGMMAAIVAPAGSGKTKLMELLAEDMNGLYIYCDGRMTATNMDQKLAIAAGAIAPATSRGAAKFREATITKLKGTERPIFIDEAHLLKPKIFADLRSIHDQTGDGRTGRPGCPIIFTGAYEILGRVDDRSTGRGQMMRRCITFNAIEHFANVEPGGDGSHPAGEPLFAIEDIRAVLEHMPLKLTKAAVEMLWAIACLPSHGCLGTVKYVLDFAWRSYGAGAKIGLDELDLVMSTLFSTRARAIVSAARTHRERYLKAG